MPAKKCKCANAFLFPHRADKCALKTVRDKAASIRKGKSSGENKKDASDSTTSVTDTKKTISIGSIGKPAPSVAVVNSEPSATGQLKSGKKMKSKIKTGTHEEKPPVVVDLLDSEDEEDDIVINGIAESLAESLEVDSTVPTHLGCAIEDGSCLKQLSIANDRSNSAVSPLISTTATGSTTANIDTLAMAQLSLSDEEPTPIPAITHKDDDDDLPLKATMMPPQSDIVYTIPPEDVFWTTSEDEKVGAPEPADSEPSPAGEPKPGKKGGGNLCKGIEARAHDKEEPVAIDIVDSEDEDEDQFVIPTAVEVGYTATVVLLEPTAVCEDAAVREQQQALELQRQEHMDTVLRLQQEQKRLQHEIDLQSTRLREQRAEMSMRQERLQIGQERKQQDQSWIQPQTAPQTPPSCTPTSAGRYGVTKSGTICKKCVKQGRRCHQHR